MGVTKRNFQVGSEAAVTELLHGIGSTFIRSGRYNMIWVKD